MKYFTNCRTLDELKKEYRRLAMLNHPDRGGDEETMKAINNEYDAVFPTFKLAYNKTAETPTHETAESTRSEFYTQNGWKGRNYKLERTTKECAEEIRSYLKKAYPDCKFSVTTHYASMCSSISVYLMSGPYAALKTKDRYSVNEHYLDKDTEMTEWAKAVIIDANDVIQSYRFSDCDGMIDYFNVNFWYDLGIGKWDKPYQINTKAKKIEGESPKVKPEPSNPGFLRVEINPEFDGVEVYFPSKPSEATRDALKLAGYRWHSKKKCWYAKNTEKNLQSLRAIEAGLTA